MATFSDGTDRPKVTEFKPLRGSSGGYYTGYWDSRQELEQGVELYNSRGVAYGSWEQFYPGTRDRGVRVSRRRGSRGRGRRWERGRGSYGERYSEDVRYSQEVSIYTMDIL